MISMPMYYPVTAHTDHVGPGTTFVSIKGYADDGARYIVQAIAQGATTIVVHNDAVLTPEIHHAIAVAKATLIRVSDTRRALAQLSAEATAHAHKKLSIIAITGTKGKTTTTFLLHHIVRSTGMRTAMVSGVKNSILDTEFPAHLTTPNADYLHQLLKLCVENNVTHVVMEVAAQGVTMQRTDGITFDGIVFTNFSREHLEFYASVEDYFAAKCQLLTQLSPHGFIGLNADDDRLANLDVSALPLPPLYFGIKASFAHMQGSLTHAYPLQAHVSDKSGNAYTCVNNHLMGHYNLYNVLAAVTAAVQLGIDYESVMEAVATFQGVPGRCERYVLPNGATAIIDYAHNISSFEAILSTLRPLYDHMIVVFGATGERDAGRRPFMGDVAAKYADQIILTSDSPRSEPLATIIAQILEGISHDTRHKVVIRHDRYEAIGYGYAVSTPHSALVILGKGAATYEYVGNSKIPFSDRAVVKKLQEATIIT